MTRGRKILAPALFSEGYCCRWGYLSLCKARGEKQVEMASFLNVPRGVVKDAYYFLRLGRYSCQGNADCLSAVIEDINHRPGDLGDDLHPPKGG